MLSKGQEGFSNIKEQEKNSEDGSKISFDAPPLDFSFKNIKSLAGKFYDSQNLKTSNQDKEKN